MQDLPSGDLCCWTSTWTVCSFGSGWWWGMVDEGMEFSTCFTWGTSGDLGICISTFLALVSSVLLWGISGILELGDSPRRSWDFPRVISALLGMGSGGLWPGSSALFKPNRETAGAEFSTCLDEMSMEISVRLDMGSGCRDPARSILLSDDFGDLWPPMSACLRSASAFLGLCSWNFWAAEPAPLRSGFGVLRGWTEGFEDWSTSSTSKDLFSAERKRT